MIQGQIIWFEIPVIDLDRAILFYSEVLDIKIEKIKFLDTEQGIFNKDKETIKGVLTVKENYNPGSGITLFFYVINLSESISKIEEFGGKIIIEKTLLKQQTAEGYLCEGNRICLYSNS